MMINIISWSLILYLFLHWVETTLISSLFLQFIGFTQRDLMSNLLSNRNSETNSNYNAVIFMNIKNLISKSKTDKIKFLFKQTLQDNALIIARTENILEAEIHIPNCTIYRQDRIGDR